MKRAYHQHGLALMVVGILLALGGFALAQINASGHFNSQLNLQQAARQSQILDQIRSALLGFSAQQGIHSQSHLGHLPCPATQPDHIAQTTCLEKPWGYLPVQSKTAINYLNIGIDARNNEVEPSIQQDWHYAVSPQLLQPNALGWSRWVDFSKPSMQLRIPAESNRIENRIVAVVAHSIEEIAEHTYNITPPFMLIRESELREHIRLVQTHLLKQTLNTWISGNFDASAVAAMESENLEPSANLQDTFRPVDSQCSCRCTKTRCTCSCNSNGNWKLANSTTDCTSTNTEPCVLHGPTSMRSGWPVSRFEPVAAANKSCRPKRIDQCPLSTGAEACTCDFSWPDNTKNSLSKFSILKTDTGEIQVLGSDQSP